MAEFWVTYKRCAQILTNCYHVTHHSGIFTVEKFSKLLFAPLISGLIAACAASPDPTDVNQEASNKLSEIDQDKINPQINYGSFTKEQLFDAIISELGAQRGDLKSASDNYFDLAMETKDLTTSLGSRIIYIK